ncbi:MAG: sortase-associated OmpA-like protein PdsO [Pseudomonadales bacterium]|nr:sortase-associated OmpA-like protein PdsO [Pseudomonadales bacterium]
MIKQLSVLSTAFVTAIVMTGSAYADNDGNASKEEATGVISGAAIGAAAGGPPGAIIGAAIGAFLGDGWVTRSDYKDMEADWVAMQLETEQYQRQAAALELEKELALKELEELRNAPLRVLPAFLNTAEQNPLFDNTAISVHFRTGSSAIEGHYEEQLTSLVKLASQLPNSALEITGYADRNGNADRNLDLSWQRTNSVKDFINGLGLLDSDITAVAYGETQPLHATQNFETDFFDRRVIVRLIDTSQQMLTQGQ